MLARLETGGSDARVELALRMHVAAEGPANGAELQVAEADVGTNPPSLVRIDEAVQASRPLRRPIDEGTPVSVAAHDPVKGHDVGILQLLGQLHEVSVMVGCQVDVYASSPLV